MESLLRAPRTWLVTGVAGFIGSHLLEALLRLNQQVRGLDNFSTGSPENLADVRAKVGESAWANFRFYEGDLNDQGLARQATEGVEIVLHQAALGSVPRSIEYPLVTNHANVSGFVSIIDAARRANVKRFVYASSSSVYGDESSLPKVEERIGKPLSPYAASKYANELYASAFAEVFQLTSVGLRYFNVFGSRQRPDGPYAAVIPRWIASLARGERCVIFGDGETSRDFCYVENVVQANLKAAMSEALPQPHVVLNIAAGARTTLLELYELIRSEVAQQSGRPIDLRPEFSPFRPGDIRHSLADISRARSVIGYAPTHAVAQGMSLTVPSHMAKHAKS